ncbi:thioredoxin domain-containing protein [Halobacteriovorax sp. HLS]|uniref:thioredoxin domain-containing protein n=1 Tax=Halobacteriovorax sp. HLS TaxID=2234000 RepID=UPI000FD81686|nr:thioredoxin family protein [Halobacteriovorax sp. HLS]
MNKIVKFTKPNCPHCVIFEPIFKEEIKKFKDELEIFEVDLSQAPHLIEVFNVKGVPSLYKFNSEDFKDFSNIEQLVIGHSHQGYNELSSSLNDLVK